MIHTLFFRSEETSDRFEREQTSPGCWRTYRQQMEWDDGDPFEWWLELTEPVPFVFDVIRTRVARMVEATIAADGVYNGFLLYFEQPGHAEVVDPSTLGP